MSSKSKSTKVTSLLDAIQRKTSKSPALAPESSSETVTQPRLRRHRIRRGPATSPPNSKGGKPVQFWLHDEDRRLVRELAAWLAGQGVRSTDSLVVRAALRTAKTGGEFLEAYRHASRLDGRLKPHRTHAST
jgi:hypothetical protein